MKRTGNTMPEALLVAPATPARTGNGLAMRLGLFRDALAQVAEVETLVVPIAGPPPGVQFEQDFGRPALAVPLRGVDTQYALLSRIADPAQRLAAFARYGRGSRHAPVSLALLEEIRARLAGHRFDLAHIGRLYLADIAGAIEAGASSLDLDEDDAWAWETLAATQAGAAAEWSRLEAVAEDRLLARRGSSFDAVFAAGPSDIASLGARHPALPVEPVTNAIAFPPSPERRDDGGTLLFVGAFGYRPNVDGVRWFVHEVWPLVRARVKRPLRLRLVGRGPTPEIRALASDSVEVVGPVESVADAYAEATLAIAPLHAGGGTRLKLIEAAAHLVPIVSTRLAARGLDFIDATTAWLGDTAPEFVEAIVAALADAGERRQRAARAFLVARQQHDRELVVGRLAQRFANMLEGREQPQAQQ